MNAKSLLHSAFLVAALHCVGCTPNTVSLDRRRDAQGMIDRGAAFLHLGMLDEAAASFRVAAETAQSAGAYDGLACTAFLKGDIKEAKKLFRQTIRWFPNYIPVRANYALLLDLEGKKETAERLYRSAISEEPLNYKWRNNYGLLLRSRDMKRLSEGFLADAYAISGDELIKKNREREN